MATSAEQSRNHQGPALFERGYRPFFLGGALLAGLTLPLWLVQYSLGLETPSLLSGRDYHIHEMIFGYLGAVIAGFLLTAVPNWTGRLPVAGSRLAILASLWLAGRLAIFTGAPVPILAAIIDSLFLVSLAAIIWREVIAGKNHRNIPVCLLTSLLALANIAYHILHWLNSDLAYAERAALSVMVLFLSLIGGRVIPSFTRNWMAQQQILPMPVAFSTYDKGLLIATIPALVSWIIAPDTIITGLFFTALAPAHLYRLMRWRGWATLNEPMVLILHIGYLWIAIWFALMALAILAPGVINSADAVHALTAGAIGTMTVAIMTRATLGHSGRAIKSNVWINTIYIAVVIGAALRVAAPILPGDLIAALSLSGILWSAGFWVFIVYFGPIFTQTRKR